MEFKYSLSLLFSNLGHAFKIFLWIVLCLVLSLAIGAAIILPIWNVIASSTDVNTYVMAIKDSLATVWNGTSTIRASIGDILRSITDIFGALAQNPGITTGLVFAAIFVYAVYCFVFGLSYYTNADIINNVMASNMRYGFASNMALNFKKCCKYSAARLTITLPIDLIFITIMLCILFGLFEQISYFVIPILMVAGIVICSLRATLLAGWLPRMIFHPEENTYTSFTRSLTYVKSNVGGLFKSYAVTFTIVYLFATVFAIPTGGLMSLVLPSMYYFMLRAIELIGYYKTKGLSFYTDATTVINTVEYGFRAEQQTENFDFETQDDAQIKIDEYLQDNPKDEK